MHVGHMRGHGCPHLITQASVKYEYTPDTLWWPLTVSMDAAPGWEAWLRAALGTSRDKGQGGESPHMQT